MPALIASRPRTVLAAVLLAAAALPASAAELVRVASAHSVPETADRLAAAIEGAGATVFARIDHAAGAEKIGESIPPNVVLIFGNPAIGTPAIKDAPGAGLDLPLRVQVVDEAGETVLIYRDPVALSEDHGLPAGHPAIAGMSGALSRLTGKAAE